MRRSMDFSARHEMELIGIDPEQLRPDAATTT